MTVWFWDLDLAIRERPIEDDWREVSTESELLEWLVSRQVDVSLAL